MIVNNRIVKILIIFSGVIIYFFAAFQICYRIDEGQVKIWDEASSARNAVEMLDTKSYLLVMKDGKPDHFDTKPPLALWLKVISFKIFGINEFAVRLPTIIAALLTMFLLLIFTVRFLRDVSYGYIMLILIACTDGYMGYHIARHGDPDALLTFFVACYIVAYFVLLEKYPLNRIRYLIFLGLAVICAVYTKSIAGLSPLAGLAIYTFTQKNGYKLLKDYRFHLTWLAVVVVIGLYYFIRAQYDPGYIKAVINQEFNTMGDPVVVKHPEFSFYYTYLKDSAFKPFSYFLPFTLIPLFFGPDKKIRRLILYSMIGGAAFLIGQSSVVLKNEWYIAPIYPFLWLLAGVGFTETVKIIAGFFRKKWISQMILSVFVLGLFFACIPLYKKIIRKNTYDLEKNYVYPPEREGRFLKRVKTKRPEIKELTVITAHPTRQVKFYAKKYNYEDSTQVSILNSIDTSLAGKKVIICIDSLKNKFETLYDFEILEEGKYGKFYLAHEKEK